MRVVSLFLQPNMIAKRVWARLLAVVALTVFSTAQTQDQKLNKADRDWLRSVLHTVHDDLRKIYYDPNFHGLDLDARFREAETKMEAAPSLNYAVADIAGAVSALNDSHTNFLPPPRPYFHDYGWRMQPVGDSDCYITAVRPGSDAAKKGIRPGDQLLSVNGYAAIREDAWKIDYVFRTLRPQPGLRLVLRSTDGSERQVDAMAELRPRTQDPWQLIDQYEHMWQDHRPKYQEFGNKAIVVRLLDFAFDNDRANEILDKVRSHEALILDLRGNPGGYVDFLIRFLGGMFDHEVKIANPVGRKPMKPSLTRTRGGKTFTGKLVVLIDSRSASASELFARVVQLARRGIVVGDRSSGKVMESRIHVHEVGTNGGMFRFALAITEADMVMSDGKSLEHTGVLPDERVLPSPADMAAGRDPALSRAAALVGVELTPEAAGKLFPAEWPKE